MLVLVQLGGLRQALAKAMRYSLPSTGPVADSTFCSASVDAATSAVSSAALFNADDDGGGGARNDGMAESVVKQLVRATTNYVWVCGRRKRMGAAGSNL